ncbi:phosphotransferase [Candidatus Gottesmanbacteria bacterium]|nr:phosphotransferase [Candidatus Gottesmanbacteria bacterium]
MKNDYLKQLNIILGKHGYLQDFSIKKDEFRRFNGIIYDRSGKNYFLKAAFGKDSYEYKSLYRESQVTKFLSTRTKKIRVSHNGYRLYVPNVAKIIDQDEIFCLITRYIEGRKLLNENSGTQVDILSATLELVSKLGKVSHISTIRPYLKNYTREALLISLPIRFIKASILSPSALPRLIRASWRALSLLSSGIYEHGLVHPDINVSNIIFDKNAIYLTDWEEAGWGMSAYNVTSPLCLQWQEKTLRDRLLARLRDNGEKKITIPLLAYRTLMLFNQHLERGNKKRKRDFAILKFLETAL